MNIHTLYHSVVVTYTNSRLPGPGVQRPELTLVQMPGASPAELLAKARAERRRDGITAVTVEGAPRVYEKLYADSIRFRKARGA